MSDLSRQFPALAADIHASAVRFVIATTGGGSQALSALVSTPGASRTILDASIPYSRPALADWLGGQPDEFCSEAAGRALAAASYLRAIDLAGRQGESSAVPLTGIGCTASLRTDREKRGAHRIHVAAQADDRCISVSLNLNKEARDRAEEEEIAAAMVLNLAAELAGVPRQLPLPFLEGEVPKRREAAALASWRELYRGSISTAVGNGLDRKPISGMLVFPGAFHPLHDGHRRMAQIAAESIHRKTHFEISIVNVDKPPLDYLEIARRCEQFPAPGQVWLTRAPTFLEKSKVFPDATFVVGADTVRRLADRAYYAGSQEQANAAIEGLRRNGARFLVFGRVLDGGFRTLSDLSVPANLLALCTEVTAEEFRDDISSTKLRQDSRTAS